MRILRLTSKISFSLSLFFFQGVLAKSSSDFRLLLGVFVPSYSYTVQFQQNYIKKLRLYLQSGNIGERDICHIKSRIKNFKESNQNITWVNAKTSVLAFHKDTYMKLTPRYVVPATWLRHKYRLNFSSSISMVGKGGSSRSFSSFFMWKGNHNFVTLLSERWGGGEGKGGEARKRELAAWWQCRKACSVSRKWNKMGESRFNQTSLLILMA